MFSLLQIKANAAVDKLAEELEKNEKIKVPEWFGQVKASSHNERLPETPKLWFKRVAAVLRTIAIRGSVGVRRMRHKFGGRTTHTVARSHHREAGGKSIRLALQQLESAGFLKKEKVGARTLSTQGQSFLEKTFKQEKAA